MENCTGICVFLIMSDANPLLIAISGSEELITQRRRGKKVLMVFALWLFDGLNPAFNFSTISLFSKCQQYKDNAIEFNTKQVRFYLKANKFNKNG